MCTLPQHSATPGRFVYSRRTGPTVLATGGTVVKPSLHPWIGPKEIPSPIAKKNSPFSLHGSPGFRPSPVKVYPASNGSKSPASLLFPERSAMSDADTVLNAVVDPRSRVVRRSLDFEWLFFNPVKPKETTRDYQKSTTATREKQRPSVRIQKIGDALRRSAQLVAALQSDDKNVKYPRTKFPYITSKR